MPGNSLPLTESRIIADLMKRQRGVAAGLVDSGGLSITVDEQEWTSLTGTTYTLRSIPLDKAVWVELNGLGLREGTDYTCDYSTGVITVVTSAQPLTSGDVLWARWITTGNLVVSSGPAFLASFTDDFNRANSTTTLGTSWSTTADGPTVANRASTWGIDTNRAYCVTAPSYNGRAYYGIAYIDGGASDGTVQCTFAVVSGSPSGLVFRWNVATAVGWLIEWNGSSLVLTHYDGTWDAGGIPHADFQATLTTAASGDVVAVDLAGSSIVVKKNGATVYSTTSSLSVTSTVHGIYGVPSFAPAFRFDDFSWTAA